MTPHSVALAMLESAAVTQSRIDAANAHISSMALSNTMNANKIKAEAVREAITHSAMNDNHKRNSYWAYDVMTKYANKLEQE